MKSSPIKRKSSLIWDDRFYSTFLNTWLLNVNEDKSITITVNTAPCPAGIYFWSVPPVATALGIMYVMIFAEDWFRVDVSAGLFFAAVVMTVGFHILYLWEVSQLKKLPETILRYSPGAECILFDGAIVIPSSSKKMIHYIYDYCPATYEDSWKNANEGMFGLYYEVNLEIITDTCRNRYGLISGKSSHVCLPVAKKLSELTGWALIVNNRQKM